MELDRKTIALLRSLFGKDENDNVYLRVVAGEAESGELKNAVSTQSNISLDGLLRKSVVLDAEGNPAIRLAAVPFGITFGDKEVADRVKVHEDKIAAAAKAKAKASKEARKSKKTDS